MKNYKEVTLEDSFLTVSVPYVKLEILRLIVDQTPDQRDYWLKYASAEERAEKFLEKAIESVDYEVIIKQWKDIVKNFAEDFGISKDFLTEKGHDFVDALLQKGLLYYNLFMLVSFKYTDV